MDRYDGWPFAKGSEQNLQLAWGLTLVTAVVGWIFGNRLAKICLPFMLGIAAIVTYFFRDPDRHVLVEEGLVVSPGDGEVVDIVTMEERDYLGREMVRISIFLSLLDVHVQRVPVSGQVKLIQHQPGQFLQAFRPEASDVNEYLATVIETAHGPVLLKQIAGILARRCVTYLEAGQQVTAGDRLGLIRFSSRLDLFLPTTAVVGVRVGDHVYGGVTPLARLQPPSA